MPSVCCPVWPAVQTVLGNGGTVTDDRAEIMGRKLDWSSSSMESGDKKGSSEISGHNDSPWTDLCYNRGSVSTVSIWINGHFFDWGFPACPQRTRWISGRALLTWAYWGKWWPTSTRSWSRCWTACSSEESKIPYRTQVGNQAEDAGPWFTKAGQPAGAALLWSVWNYLKERTNPAAVGKHLMMLSNMGFIAVMSK